MIEIFWQKFSALYLQQFNKNKNTDCWVDENKAVSILFLLSHFVIYC